MMKLSRNRWIVLSRITAVIIVAVLVGLVPSCCARKEKPAPVPTATPAPTATGIGLPTATVTGTAYATPTATGADQLPSETPPAPTTNVSVTATATPQSTITAGPNTTFFDQPVYNVKKGGETFNVYVMWSGSEEPPCGLWGGQFDLFYNGSLISLVSQSAGVVEGLTANYIGTANGTYGGQNYVFITTDWEDDTGWGLNGSGYWVKYTFKPSEENTGTTGLNFSDERAAIEAIGVLNWDIFEIEPKVYINGTVNVQ